jgi:6-hydroxytryprostatin B O-methyltransferase
MDTVLPVPSDNEDLNVEAMLRVRDLTMLETFNSRERELGDWIELLDALGKGGNGEPRLELKGIRKPFGSMMSILEVGVASTDSK